MPNLKLTVTNIDRVVKAGGKADTLYWDTETKGFGLRVTPTGRATYIAQARLRDPPNDIRITIGSVGPWTLNDARRKAEDHKRQCEDGVDPRALKKEEEARRVSLMEVCTAYVSRPGKLKASTAAEYVRHVEKVFAAWKDKPIVSITRDMVQERHREMLETGLTGRGAPASANAAFVTLRILINFAMDEYRRPDGEPLILHNPVAALKRHWAKTGDRRDRYIDMEKVGAVWNMLMDARLSPKNRDALASIDLTIFALLTGARRNEMAGLAWDRVHLDDEPSKCRWHLIDRKRGTPIWLPLSSQAVALLRARLPEPRLDGEASPFVFPTWSKPGHIADARAPMELVSKLVGQHLSLHDMRRTFSTISQSVCRIEKFRTDLLTGHKPNSADVTSRYYLDLARLEWLHPEVQAIGDWIEQEGRIAKAKASGANVVALPVPA